MQHRARVPSACAASSLAMAALFGFAVPARGAAVSGAVGYEHYVGPSGQETGAALGLASIAGGGGDVLVGGLRYDDRHVGAGSGLVVGGGIRLGPATAFRLMGTRFFGDRDYRAWRLRAGPVHGLSTGGSLGVFYQHDASNLVPASEAVLAELGVPVVANLTGKLGTSYVWTDDVDGVAISAGAGWTVIPHLEISGEVGAAQTGLGLAAAPAPRAGLFDELLGDGSDPNPPSRREKFEGTALLGLRVVFP